MKLATLADGSRDGRLVVVDRTGERYLEATGIAPNLQTALDDWERVSPRLLALAAELERERGSGRPLDVRELLAPLPRAYEWVDGSAYLSHVLLVRKARGAEPPPSLWDDPLVYQGASGVLLGPAAPFALPDESWGLDFEGEIAVILGDVAPGTPSSQAAAAIRLVTIVNDWTYRQLVPSELAKGFGFFNSKPATSFAGFALTPDELGAAFSGGRLHARLHCTLNGKRVGQAQAGVGMHFSFHDLIAHIAKTRAFTAGTILGSGTVSNEDEAAGVSCLSELRTRESLQQGAAKTPWLRVGDHVRIELALADGSTPFGAIDSEVIAP